MELYHTRIHLLGTFCVYVGEHMIVESAWRRRKAKSLVKLLALASKHALHREQVMDYLWPDFPIDAAANNLHQTVHIARRIFDPSGDNATCYLHLHDEMLSLCPHDPMWVDVEAFEAAVAAARQSPNRAAYQNALDLYTGELLPEDLYVEWVGNRRQSLRADYLAICLAYALYAEAQQEYSLAIQTLQQLLATDPAHEEAHSALMRIYARSGQRQLALRQFQVLKESLWQELEAEPAPQHLQLADEIRAGRYGPTDLPTANWQPQDTDDELRAAAVAPVRNTPVPRNPNKCHNLPIQLTRFIGREAEQAEVRRLQATTRLLTLTGPGGSGKTRLALETAAGSDPTNSYRDGIAWVELAALSDPDLVVQAVAAALLVREVPDQPLLETLVSYLQPKPLLLVLDNCEHLIEACARLADTLLRTCPGLRILATSREPLHIPGELTWPVPPLSLPKPQDLPPVEQLLQYEALQLFIDRASAVLPTFSTNQYNAAAIAHLCQQLDGLPLAIELAAARVRLLTVAQIVERLDDRFRLLVGGSRLALTRQQTLRATLDWSHDLLSEPEQMLLRRLSVFAGGCSLQAIEDICAGQGLPQTEILERLSQLVDKSLIEVRDGGQERRYQLLETVRQYGIEKLRAAGEEPHFRAQHQAWYLALAVQADPELYGARRTV